MHYHVIKYALYALAVFPVQHSRPKNNAAMCRRPLNARPESILPGLAGGSTYCCASHYLAASRPNWRHDPACPKAHQSLLHPVVHTHAHTDTHTHHNLELQTPDTRRQSYRHTTVTFTHTNLQPCTRSHSVRRLPSLRIVAAENTRQHAYYTELKAAILAPTSSYWRTDDGTDARTVRTKKKLYPITGTAGSELLPIGVATVGGVVTGFIPGNTSMLDRCDRDQLIRYWWVWRTGLNWTLVPLKYWFYSGMATQA